MRKLILTMVAVMTMSMAMAQDNNNNRKGPGRPDATSVTEMMTKQLELTSDQQAKVAQLNEKYKELFKGPGMRGGRGFGKRPQDSGNQGQRPELTEEQKAQMKERMEKRQAQQKEYNAELKSILSSEQFEKYQKMRPQRGGHRKAHAPRNMNQG